MFTVAKKRKARCAVKPPQPQPKDRSKPRSISVNKSKENIRLKTKQDHDQDDSKVRHKAFISLNEEVDAVDKRNYQTVNEAEARRRRTPIPRKTKTNSSHSHLLKAEPRKRDVVSAMEIKRKSKEKIKPKKPKLPSAPISRKPRLQISVDQLNHMEFGNPDHLMSVTSSGDIVFSSQVESRHSLQQRPQSTAIELHDQYEMDPNAMLRVMLTREYKRKYAAVVKIQKIWRGYQTRKLLDKVLADVIKDYKPRPNETSSPSDQHYQNFAPMRRSRANEQPSLSFNTAKISSEYGHEELADCSEIKPTNGANMEECPIINPNYVPQPFEAEQKQPYEHHQTIQPIEFEHRSLGPQTDQLEQYDRDEEDYDDDAQVVQLYRHQRAIHSYEDIHEYLQESQKHRQPIDDDDDYDQEEDDDIQDLDDRFQPEVIMETNEEYLDSRKNSVQTKKNKTIESRKQSKDRDEGLEVRKFSKEDSQLEYRKRSQQIQSKHYELEQPQQRQTTTIEFGKYHQPTHKSPMREKENLGVGINVLDRGDTESTKEDYKEEVVRLKKDEIEKWSRMIEMIKATMRGSTDPQMEILLNQIIQQSEENKKWLEDHLQKNSETIETRLTTRQQEVPSKPRFIFEDSKPQKLVSPSEFMEKKKQEQPPAKSMFRKKNLELNIDNIEGTFKKDAPAEFIPGVKSRSDQSHLSKQMEINWNLELQTSNKASTSKKSIKKVWQEKMVNMSTNNLNDIISVREEMLKERKESEQNKLRKLLSEKRIELSEFEHRINSLLEYVESEKADIERARKDIEKGLRVAAQVAAKSQRDARLLGKSIGFSKSADQLKRIHQFSVPFQPSERLIVDEVVPRVRPRNFFCDDSASNSSDNSFINEEELKRYRDPKFGSLELSDMNKNIMIEEFLKSQKTESYKNNFRREPQAPLLQQPVPLAEEEHVKEPELDSSTLRAEGNLIVEALLHKLLTQSSYEILSCAAIYESVSKRLGMKMNIPKRITREEMYEFIGLVDRRMPPSEQLLPRLNQQISPAPLELLKCMRVDPQYEEQEFSEEQLGKYEFVIPQHCCTDAIRDLEQRQKIHEQPAPVEPFPALEELDEQMRNFVQRRQRSWKRRAQELKNMRHEVFNNEMHCIFDCWNEQIIQIKQILPGFSGIGLNETTLSLQDHNVKVALNDVSYYINRAREKLMTIVADDSQVLHKIEMMSRQQICESEGDWIYYADETLGLVLELDYVICEKFIDEVVRFLLAQQKKAAWNC